MMNANLALRRKLIAHVETEYANNGKAATGEIMKAYLDRYENCGDINAYNSLLADITTDAQA